MKDLERAVSICDEQGVPVKLALDLLPARNAHIEVEELRDPASRSPPVLRISSRCSRSAPSTSR
jgi:hypothetical protein